MAGGLLLYSIACVPLFSLGLWHLYSCCRAFFSSPREFSARSWHPFPAPFCHLELYLELLSFLLALVYQAVSLTGLPKGSTPQIFGLQQFVMLLIFFVVLLITLVSERTGALPLPSEAVFLMLGVAFSMEWMVLDRVLNRDLILERECFQLLGAVAALCACSCLLIAWRPKAFFVNLVLCVGISLQGTWLLQIGLSLYTEGFLPEGCHRTTSGYIQCDVDPSKLRAKALMDLAFIIHVVVVIFVFTVAYALISKGVGYKRNAGYDALEGNGESDLLQMKPLSTKVVVD